jgi:hypothetical protein
LYAVFVCEVYLRCTFKWKNFRPFSGLVDPQRGRQVMLLPSRRRLVRDRLLSGSIPDLEEKIPELNTQMSGSGHGPVIRCNLLFDNKVLKVTVPDSVSVGEKR